ncbi:hypothetical protein M3Y96_00302300 [Aphelenchoides besseyi]|nr:hypothetical protein M3Y96_00302300 [Aphelenchoides besseyi]
MWLPINGFAFVLLSTLFVVSYGVNQCSLGHKVYSIESGNTVCAPLAPHQCIHSCQWNSSCSNTAHSHAFHGRRTFVAGMILTSDNFLLLCCATFANVVQQSPSVRFDPPLNINEYVRDIQMTRLKSGRVEIRSQICKFITQRTNCDEISMPEEDKQPYSLLQLRLSRAETFLREHNGTDPRQFFALPDGPAQDQFRDEVAETKSPQLHSLADGLKSNSTTTVRQIASTNSTVPSRPQPPQQGNRLYSSSRLTRCSSCRSSTSTIHTERRSEFGSWRSRFSQICSSTRSFLTAALDDSTGPFEVPQADSTSFNAPFARRIDTSPSITSPRVVQPIRADAFDADGQQLNQPSSSPSTQVLNGGSESSGIWARRIRPTMPQVLSVAANRWATMSPRSLTRHRHQHLMPEETSDVQSPLFMATGRRIHAVATSRLGGVSSIHSGEHDTVLPHTHASTTAFGERFVSPDSSGDTFFSVSPASKPSNPGPRYILSTNQTHEFVPKFRRNFAREWHTKSRGFADSDASNRLTLLRHSLLFAKPIDEEIDERPMKSALAIRKLHLGDSTTSFGGSFAPPSTEIMTSAPQARSLQTFRSGSDRSNALAALEFAQKSVEQQQGGVRLPHGVVFAPAQRTIQHSITDDGVDRVTFQNSARPSAQIPVVVASAPVQSISAFNNRLPTVDVEQNRQSMHLLLDCCQQQAPGCRHLCTPDVSKEEVKNALLLPYQTRHSNKSMSTPKVIQSIQMGLLLNFSMTSVLQCFPRFYNISSVGQCCEQAAATYSSAPSPSLLTLNTPPRLPGQCQSLCAPNFKLSFSHFACVDHISTIVDCYRDLLLR